MAEQQNTTAASLIAESTQLPVDSSHLKVMLSIPSIELETGLSSSRQYQVSFKLSTNTASANLSVIETLTESNAEQQELIAEHFTVNGESPSITSEEHILGKQTLLSYESQGFQVAYLEEPTGDMVIMVQSLSNEEGTVQVPALNLPVWAAATEGNTAQAVDVALTTHETYTPDYQEEIVTIDPDASTLALQATPAETATTPPEISVDSASIVSVMEDHGTVEITLTLSEASSEDITVLYEITDYDAERGDDKDYTIDNGGANLITFSKGSTTATVSIALNDDQIADANFVESVLLQLTDVVTGNATVNSVKDHALVNIIDTGDTAEPPPPVEPPTQEPALISISEANKRILTEEGQTIEIEVLRAGNLEGEVTVDYTVNFDGGADSDDYTIIDPTTGEPITNHQVTFADGETSKTITVKITDDTTPEALEGFQVELELADDGGNVKIDEEDDFSTVSILDDDGGEGDPNAEGDPNGEGEGNSNIAVEVDESIIPGEPENAIVNNAEQSVTLQWANEGISPDITERAEGERNVVNLNLTAENTGDGVLRGTTNLKVAINVPDDASKAAAAVEIQPLHEDLMNIIWHTGLRFEGIGPFVKHQSFSTLEPFFDGLTAINPDHYANTLTTLTDTEGQPTGQQVKFAFKNDQGEEVEITITTDAASDIANVTVTALTDKFTLPEGGLPILFQVDQLRIHDGNEDPTYYSIEVTDMGNSGITINNPAEDVEVIATPHDDSTVPTNFEDGALDEGKISLTDNTEEYVYRNLNTAEADHLRLDNNQYPDTPWQWELESIEDNPAGYAADMGIALYGYKSVDFGTIPDDVAPPTTSANVLLLDPKGFVFDDLSDLKALLDKKANDESGLNSSEMSDLEAYSNTLIAEVFATESNRSSLTADTQENVTIAFNEGEMNSYVISNMELLEDTEKSDALTADASDAENNITSQILSDIHNWSVARFVDDTVDGNTKFDVSLLYKNDNGEEAALIFDDISGDDKLVDSGDTLTAMDIFEILGLREPSTPPNKFIDGEVEEKTIAETNNTTEYVYQNLNAAEGDHLQVVTTEEYAASDWEWQVTSITNQHPNYFADEAITLRGSAGADDLEATILLLDSKGLVFDDFVNHMDLFNRYNSENGTQGKEFLENLNDTLIAEVFTKDENRMIFEDNTSEDKAISFTKGEMNSYVIKNMELVDPADNNSDVVTHPDKLSVNADSNTDSSDITSAILADTDNWSIGRYVDDTEDGGPAKFDVALLYSNDDGDKAAIIFDDLQGDKLPSDHIPTAAELLDIVGLVDNNNS